MDCKLETSRCSLRPQRRRGVTLIETVLSVMILGGAFVAVLNTIATSRAAQAVAAERQYARLLAEDLLAEILSKQKYKEGDSIGKDLDEAVSGRPAFDDVDDYHNYVDLPPSDADGNALPGADGLMRWVGVFYANPLTPNQQSGTDQGLKYILVMVRRGNKRLAVVHGYRSDQWTPPQEQY